MVANISIHFGVSCQRARHEQQVPIRVQKALMGLFYSFFFFVSSFKFKFKFKIYMDVSARLVLCAEVGVPYLGHQRKRLSRAYQNQRVFRAGDLSSKAQGWNVGVLTRPR